MSSKIGIFAVGFLAAFNAAANECTKIEADIANISKEYEPAFKQLEKDGKKIEDDAPEGGEVALGVDFVTDWKEQRWRFHTPSFVMKTQRIVFGAPQVTMKDKKMSMDLPVTVMVAKKVGQYPETKCENIFQCTVKWSDIITHVPETTMKRVEWVMGVPETRWDNTEIKLDLPEFFLQEQTWFVKIPEITVKNVSVETKKIEERGQEIKARGELLATELKEKTNNKASELMLCHSNQLQAQKVQVEAMFRGALTQIEASIETAKIQGGDPANLKDSAGNSINLVAQRNQLIKERDAALKSFDDALKKMQEGITNTTNKSATT